MVHVAITRQWDGLNQSKNACHMHHGQLLTRRLLSVRLRSDDCQQSHENREKPLHWFFLNRSFDVTFAFTPCPGSHVMRCLLALCYWETASAVGLALNSFSSFATTIVATPFPITLA